MIPIAPNNRPLNDILAFPQAIGPFTVPLSIRISIDPIASVVKWTWNVVVLNVKDDWLPLTFLFIGALGIFPIWPGIAIAAASTALIYRSISIDRSNAINAAELRARNQTLRNQNLLLTNQRGELQIRYDDARIERDGLIQQREHFSIERGELLRSRTQITLERNHLADEIQRLRQKDNTNQNRLIVPERNESEDRRKQLEEQSRHQLRELGELRALMGQVDAHTKLRETLERFHDLYQQNLGGQENRGALLQFAQERLIPQFIAHRVTLHEMLKTSMDRLEADDLAQIPLNGILRLSENEMHHLEQISEIILLIRELREPLGLMLNINNAAGNI